MRAIVDRHAVEINQAEIGLVHQRRRLQCVSGAFGLQLCPRDAPQFVVDDRKQLIEGRFVALAPLQQ